MWEKNRRDENDKEENIDTTYRVKHGKQSQDEKEKKEIESVEIEIPVEEKSFDGDIDEIIAGLTFVYFVSRLLMILLIGSTFVSYKYNGDAPNGLPITPAVSCFFSLLSSSYIISFILSLLFINLIWLMWIYLQ